MFPSVLAQQTSLDKFGPGDGSFTFGLRSDYGTVFPVSIDATVKPPVQRGLGDPQEAGGLGLRKHLSIKDCGVHQLQFRITRRHCRPSQSCRQACRFDSSRCRADYKLLANRGVSR
jgi:hypothetical protein